MPPGWDRRDQRDRRDEVVGFLDFFGGWGCSKPFNFVSHSTGQWYICHIDPPCSCVWKNPDIWYGPLKSWHVVPGCWNWCFLRWFPGFQLSISAMLQSSRDSHSPTIHLPPLVLLRSWMAPCAWCRSWRLKRKRPSHVEALVCNQETEKLVWIQQVNGSQTRSILSRFWNVLNRST